MIRELIRLQHTCDNTAAECRISALPDNLKEFIRTDSAKP